MTDDNLMEIEVKGGALETANTYCIVKDAIKNSASLSHDYFPQGRDWGFVESINKRVYRKMK